MLNFKKVILSDENKIFKSRKNLFDYLFFNWTPLLFPLLNFSILFGAEAEINTFDVAVAPVMIFFINIFFNFFITTDFLVTDKNLKIIRTVFFTKVTSYPLRGIQRHALDESYGFREIHAYWFKIKFNNAIKRHRLYNLSEKSIEKLQKIEVHRNAKIPSEQVENYNALSVYFIINVVDLLLIICFWVLCIKNFL